MARKAKAPANPLEDSPARDQRIRERAYHLWDAEGRPHGRDVEFWERAETLMGMEDSAGAGQIANPSADGAPPPPATPIEEASIQENLGEFPSQLIDQGDTPPTPKARKPKAAPAEPVKPAEAKTTPAKAAPARSSRAKPGSKT